MSEELKPCPHCGSESCRVIGGPGTKGGPQFWAGCDHCNGRAWGDTQSEAIAAWNRRAPMTAPTPEGQGGGEALIEWLTGLVNEGGDAPIEMPIRDMKTLLALLSSPRVEEARAALIEIRDGTIHFWTRERAEAALAALATERKE